MNKKAMLKVLESVKSLVEDGDSVNDVNKRLKGILDKKDLPEDILNALIDKGIKKFKDEMIDYANENGKDKFNRQN